MSNPTEIAYAHTPEWWAARRTGIGASQAAAVLRLPATEENPEAIDVSQYRGPLAVYHECRGELKPEPENNLMFAGKVLEEGAARLYERHIGHPVTYPMPMYRHADYPFMLATPDAMVDGSRGAEFKVTNYRILKKVRDYGVLKAVPDYVCQVQQQMAVMGWESVDLALLVEKTIHVFEIDRSDRLIEMLAEAEAELWERIEAGTPPEFDASEPGALELVKRIHHTIKPGFIRLPSHVIDLQAEYERLSEQAREIEKRQKQIRAEQLHLIGDHEGGLLPGGKCLRRSVVKRKPTAACEFTTARVVKLPADAQLIEPPEWARRFDAAERQLREAGFLRHDKSESGSRYWIDSDGHQVRVSDHAPNQATAEWMASTGCIDIRVDQPTDINQAVREAIAPAALKG